LFRYWPITSVSVIHHEVIPAAPPAATYRPGGPDPGGNDDEP
jgi:hypothetical protein